MVFCRKASPRRSFEIRLFGPASRILFDSHGLKRAFSRAEALRALILPAISPARALAIALAIASVSISAALAQETEKPQTQASPSPAAQTPPGQTSPDQVP